MDVILTVLSPIKYDFITRAKNEKYIEIDIYRYRQNKTIFINNKHCVTLSHVYLIVKQ